MLLALAAAFVAAVVVWRAGGTLSRDADALAATTGLSAGFVGTVLLGTATSLPEIATTITAGVLGNAQLATGNLLGGVALQIVVLAIADGFGRRRPLTTSVDQPALLVQHVTLLLLLSLAIAGMAAGEPVAVLGIGVWPLAIAVVYAGSLLVLHEGQAAMRWQVTPKASRSGADDRADEDRDAPERPPVWRIGLSCAAILVAGWVLARSGDRISQEGVLNATFLGAAFVALATSLPELSTVITSVRAGSYDMAVSNIVGTNTLELALLLVADIALRKGPLLSFATPSDVFLAALAAVLTCLYLGGILLRHDRTAARFGYDSVAVVVVYVLGLGVVMAL